MSDEERRDSLADQAAAWIPPWERPTPPTPPTETEPEPAAVPDLGTGAPPEGPDRTKIVEEAPAAAAPAGAEPEILDTYRSPRTGTDQDRAGESAGEPDAVPGAGEPAMAAEDAVGGDAPAGEPEGEGGAGGVPGKRGRRRPAPEPEPAPVLDDAELRGALEAILLVVDQPVSELTLAQVLEQSPERIGPMLDEIAAGYTAAGHGFELRRAAGGWRLYTRPEYATYVERFVLEGQSVRLTQAALETLAVIAYKQPVTRSRISAIRGVNCDGVIRTLVSRGLVEECGTEADSGAFLYRTTTMFLEKLGLNSVDDLPPLAPFLPDDVEELADATR
ncbi:SMC-Scp complex subunit ScpB [Micromonospora chaiyaphumensis]|uniref:Segregation and condensation protein B n=1 Tax=Micromonospora chaiyaphumensis TaxID=307119 RepID=A0A1C4Y9N7_9ACTN|nr:SMC-Scp complex subunit ScpB [Micromonospora chaiyaphumensis]SCF17437.1 segregation and condensation protein B [Micromonospora chaiyaphumensis]